MKLISTLGFSLPAVLILVGVTSSPLLAFDTGDEYADLYWHNTNTLQNVIWLMHQTKYETNRELTSTVAPWHMVAVVDFDRDGVSDLLWRDETTGHNAIWLMNFDGTRKAAQPITQCNTNWSVIGAYDANSDGSPDIWWRHKTLDENAIWYMNSTNFTAAENFSISTGLRWKASAIADCNNDGYGDIIWRELSGSGRVAIWFMRGTNLVLSSIVSDGVGDLVQGDQNWKIIGAGQLSRLGNTDLIWQLSGSTNYCWLMGGNRFYKSLPMPTTDPNWQLGGIGGYVDGIQHEMLLTGLPDSASSNIVLNWRYGSEKPDIYRRNAGTTNWGSPLVKGSLARRLTDRVTIGQRYEYKVGERFLYSAIGAPPIHNRGKLILVVDQTKTNSIEPDLLILKTNLVGDGWTVIRTNVPSHNDTNWSANVSPIASIKSFIMGQYNADPANTRMVFLIGHVPTPYSGTNNSDGHPEHIGAWPTDGYYGSTNATKANGVTGTEWTDKSANLDNFSDDDNDNFIGDGKWDNDFFPLDAAGNRIHLAVSRVDFAKLESFFSPTNGATPKTEVQLLSQYLKKDDRYRNKKLSFPARAVVGGYFREDSSQIASTRFIYRNALENSSRWFGINAGVMTSGDFLNEPFPFFSGLLAGYGGHFSIQAEGIQTNSQHWAQDLALPQFEPKGAIYMLHGSYFADFLRRKNNLYRATLATPNYGLIAIANSAGCACPQWKFEPTGLDEPFGTGIVRTINEAGPFGAHRWLGMQGDPTLRAFVLAPPSNLTANNGPNVTLTWAASPPSEGTVQYFVYRSLNNLDGPWTNLTSDAITATNYLNSGAPPVPKMYCVRASKLTVTGSGSFTNLSQGIFVNVD